MADTDYRDYFNSKLSQEMDRNHDIGISTKYDEVQQASKDKIAKLEELRQKELAKAPMSQRSWVEQHDLDPKSIPGMLLDSSAHINAGLSRAAGFVAGIVPSAYSMGANLFHNDRETEAFNNYSQNKATPEDLALLNKPSTIFSKYEGQATLLDDFKKEMRARQASNEIAGFFNNDHIADQTNKNSLSEGIGAAVDANWDQTKAGVKELLMGSGTGNGLKDSIRGAVH